MQTLNYLIKKTKEKKLKKKREQFLLLQQSLTPWSSHIPQALSLWLQLPAPPSTVTI